MDIQFIDEFKLLTKDKIAIASLLKDCFPDINYNGRTYFKQMPHYRLLAKQNNLISGQLGLDYRVMKQNNTVIKILGVIDLAVLPNQQGKGVASKLLTKLDDIAKTNKQNIDFILLSADNHSLYKKHGYTLSKQNIKWLAIDQHKNYGIMQKKISNCIMYKQIGKIKWKDNSELEMLGYWY